MLAVASAVCASLVHCVGILLQCLRSQTSVCNVPGGRITSWHASTSEATLHTSNVPLSILCSIAS